MALSNLFGNSKQVAQQISDKYGVTVRKAKTDAGETVRFWNGEQFVGAAGYRELENELANAAASNESSSGGGQVRQPGFIEGGPNDPAEGGDGYQGSPVSQDNTSASNNGGMATSFLVGVIMLGYLAYRWWM